MCTKNKQCDLLQRLDYEDKTALFAAFVWPCRLAEGG